MLKTINYGPRGFKEDFKLLLYYKSTDFYAFIVVCLIFFFSKNYFRIWFQTFCKGRQQMLKVAVSKEFYIRVKNLTISTGVKSPGL